MLEEEVRKVGALVKRQLWALAFGHAKLVMLVSLSRDVNRQLIRQSEIQEREMAWL